MEIYEVLINKTYQKIESFETYEEALARFNEVKRNKRISFAKLVKSASWGWYFHDEVLETYQK